MHPNRSGTSAAIACAPFRTGGSDNRLASQVTATKLAWPWNSADKGRVFSLLWTVHKILCTASASPLGLGAAPHAGSSPPCQRGCIRGSRGFIGVSCCVREPCLASLWMVGCSLPPTIWVTALGSGGKRAEVLKPSFFPTNSGFPSPVSCPPAVLRG